MPELRLILVPCALGSVMQHSTFTGFLPCFFPNYLTATQNWTGTPQPLTTPLDLPGTGRTLHTPQLPLALPAWCDYLPHHLPWFQTDVSCSMPHSLYSVWCLTLAPPWFCPLPAVPPLYRHLVGSCSVLCLAGHHCLAVLPAFYTVTYLLILFVSRLVGTLLYAWPFELLPACGHCLPVLAWNVAYCLPT